MIYLLYVLVWFLISVVLFMFRRGCEALLTYNTFLQIVLGIIMLPTIVIGISLFSVGMHFHKGRGK